MNDDTVKCARCGGGTIFDVAFICDQQSTRIEVFQWRGWKDHPLLLSYTVGDGKDVAMPVQAIISIEYIKRYKLLFPRGEMSITFATDVPVQFVWEDADCNEYLILTAPRVVDYQ